MRVWGRHRMQINANAGPAMGELHAGWRILIFPAIVACLMVAKADLMPRLPHGGDQATAYLVDKMAKFGVFLVASWIMARIEARRVADNGLPGTQVFRRSVPKGEDWPFSPVLGSSHACMCRGL